MEKSQELLIPALILRLGLLIFQIGPSRHPPMNLVVVNLNVLFALQRLLESLHVIGAFVLGCKDAERDRDGLGVLGIQHRRMQFRSCREQRILSTAQAGNLPTPAISDNAPFLDLAAGLLVHSLDDLRDGFQGLARLGLVLEEGAEFLLVLFGLGRVPRRVGWAAVEEVGHVDLILVFLV